MTRIITFRTDQETFEILAPLPKKMRSQYIRNAIICKQCSDTIMVKLVELEKEIRQIKKKLDNVKIENSYHEDPTDHVTDRVSAAIEDSMQDFI